MGRGVVAEVVAEGVPQDVAQDLAFGARAARALIATPPPPPPPSLCISRWNGGATGQLSGIWLGLWASASGGAAQSASMILRNGELGPFIPVNTWTQAAVHGGSFLELKAFLIRICKLSIPSRVSALFLLQHPAS